jgi:hypothetical protein
MPRQLPAKWHVNRWDGDGTVSLQIELGAGYAVLLTVSQYQFYIWRMDCSNIKSDVSHIKSDVSHITFELVADRKNLAQNTCDKCRMELGGSAPWRRRLGLGVV